MITEKQMKTLPAGEFSNTDLNKVFLGHCVGKGLKPQFNIANVGTMEHPKYVRYLMNRKQRRSKQQHSHQ